VADLSMSDNAVNRVKALRSAEGDEALALRLYITGGGCSGFSYGFTFDSNTREDDTIVEKDGVALLVDSLSIQYLAGANVDYSEGLQGARFIVENPNATTTCGCGSSFSM